MIKWPKVFTTGILDEYEKKKVIKIGLKGWELEKKHDKVPDKFGDGLVAISKIIGVVPTEINLRRLSKTI